MKALLGGVGLWLALIFVALLVLANEVRFQGCVQRQDIMTLAAIQAQSAEQAAGVRAGPECSRVPFVA